MNEGRASVSRSRPVPVVAVTLVGGLWIRVKHGDRASSSLGVVARVRFVVSLEVLVARVSAHLAAEE